MKSMLDGVVNLNKPKGMSSQEAVTAVLRRLGVKKGGHAGTLDPMATGVLLVCLGEATKISSCMMGLEKEYMAEMTFGARTDTLDAEGEVVERSDRIVGRQELEAALAGFRGTIKQRPPMYSALKRGGVPLYKLARQGVEVEREEREVTVYSLTLESFEFPAARIFVRCSKGTYIRTLVDDIASSIGAMAYMSALVRTRVGAFSVEDAASLDSLTPSRPDAISLERALAHMPFVRLTVDETRRALHGSPVEAPRHSAPEGEICVLDDSGKALALGDFRGGVIKMKRLLRPS